MIELRFIQSCSNNKAQCNRIRYYSSDVFSVSLKSVLRVGKREGQGGGGGGGGEQRLKGNVLSLEVQSAVVVNFTPLCNMTICFGRISQTSK
jgi:hypothetical protein